MQESETLIPDGEDMKDVPISPVANRKSCSGRLNMDNGITSVDGKELYYFGIIDILQDFNARKKTEWMVKFGRADISCQPPDRYRKRFMAFFDKCIVDDDEIPLTITEERKESR